jgi:hypothetical protein
MEIPLTCIAKGRNDHWEAICLDLNIAAQGHSFGEVERLLTDAIETYIEDVMKENEQDRAHLLLRPAPLTVRLSWIGGLILATLTGRAGRADRDGKASSATVPFAVPCHA